MNLKDLGIRYFTGFSIVKLCLHFNCAKKSETTNIRCVFIIRHTFLEGVLVLGGSLVADLNRLRSKVENLHLHMSMIFCTNWLTLSIHFVIPTSKL